MFEFPSITPPPQNPTSYGPWIQTRQGAFQRQFNHPTENVKKLQNFNKPYVIPTINLQFIRCYSKQCYWKDNICYYNYNTKADMTRSI